MLHLSDYDFDLPAELIAQTPLEDRAASRMLHIERETGQIHHRSFRDLGSFLRPGDVIVVNRTLVTARRLLGHKVSGGAVEALLLQRLAEPGCYSALMKPGKRLQVGALVAFGDELTAEVLAVQPNGERTLRFHANRDIDTVIQEVGDVPLPHYIHERLRDESRYQTVFASTPGSAAAPTAGLHFTEEVVNELKLSGIRFAEVTLDVGIDTFRPIKVEDVREHQMHGERCSISEESAEVINSAQGRILAVGTTSARTLESLAIGPRQVRSGEVDTHIFIHPGKQFQVLNGLLTNFHMPRTSMLLMVAALAGYDIWRRSYAEAILYKYRFLSFGDCMAIL